MTIPRIASLLLMLAVGCDALALQMGQASTQSERGQTLNARISLYGMSPAPDVAPSVELIAEFGAAPNSLVALGLHAAIKNDARGDAYIALTSSAAYDDASLAFRLRLKHGTRAVVQHYRLVIPAAPRPQPARLIRNTRPPQPRHAAAPVAVAELEHPGGTQSGIYGPVRAGQSLWRILEETGLARGDVKTRMRNIVAANPTAFVAGDATRLRVGAMLNVPTANATTRVVPMKAAPAVAANPVAREAITAAELAARLERLAVKFAEIRTRYAAQAHPQSSPRAAVPPLVHQPLVAAAIVTQDAQTVSAPAPTEPVVIKNAQPAPPAAPESVVETAPSAGSSQTAFADYIDGASLKYLGGLLLLGLVIVAGGRFAHRLRGRRAAAGVRSADRALVAHITRKAEKRVQLEGEVKRMIAGRRASGDQAPAQALSPADLLTGARASLADIENRIAHGQYNEAEAMLEQTLADTPNNFRAKLRLAEIYYLNERLEEFVGLADEIYRQHRADIGDENWARLMRMGKVIAPASPPFSGPIAVEAGRQTG